MVQRLFRRYSCLRVLVQHRLEQVPTLFAQQLKVLAVKVNLTLTVLLHHLLHLLSLEHWLLEQPESFKKLQNVENDSQRKDIALRVVGFDIVRGLDLEHFRSDVTGSAAPDIKVLLLVPVISKPQIDNDWEDFIGVFRILFDHDIFEFEIPMHDALLVHKIDSLQEPLHDFFDLDLTGKSILLQVAIQGKTQQFHNNISGVFGFKNPFKFTNVFVVEFGQESELFLERYLS